jgi:hypothetical protein
MATGTETRKNVTKEEFCLCWDKHQGNAQAAADELGLQVAHVRNQANKLRKKGYPLCPLASQRGRGMSEADEKAEIDRIARLIGERHIEDTDTETESQEAEVEAEATV